MHGQPDAISRCFGQLGKHMRRFCCEFTISAPRETMPPNACTWLLKRPPLHITFEARNKAKVKKFSKAALAVGATDNGAPGYRKEYWPGYYAAFVHDADDHNMEYVFYDYNEK